MYETDFTLGPNKNDMVENGHFQAPTADYQLVAYSAIFIVTHLKAQVLYIFDKKPDLRAKQVEKSGYDLQWFLGKKNDKISMAELSMSFDQVVGTN